ncbi:MAG: ABC transporter permease subunit, partial [Oscillospiraceae bacterium]|nr:ABC transporter permease subunit [Oscillospiraceae bacterium]
GLVMRTINGISQNKIIKVIDMLDILKFELYKIVKRKLFLFSPIIILGTIITLLTGTLSSAYSYDENGNHVFGYKAIKYEKAYAEKVSGELTPEKVADAIELYNKIANNPDNLTEYGTFKESAYILELYPYQKIIRCVAVAYTQNGFQPDYRMIETLTYDDGLDFYNRRDKQIIDTLNMDYSYGNYSDAEKNIILKFNGNVSEPYVLGYTLGWESLIQYSFAFFVILTFVALINVSSVFSNEFQRGTAQVILSSKHGRSKIFTAKIISAFLISTLMFVVFVGIYVLTYAAVYGLDGSGASIQSLNLLSVYDFTLGEAFFTAVIIAYAAFIFVIFFTLTISVICKSNFTSVLLALALYFIPIFLNYSKSSKLFNYIVDLFPIKALNAFEMFKQYKLYGFSETLVRQPYFLMALMPILTVILTVAAKNIYSRLSYD